MKKTLATTISAAALVCGYLLLQDGGNGKAVAGLELPATSPSEIIINHSGYTLSYNTSTLIPNWVAYELTSEELEGDEGRGDRMFSKDPSFRGKQAMREDYSGSGWTKGHMDPAADFRWDSDAMDETFYLTNVCPQNEHLNQKDWRNSPGWISSPLWRMRRKTGWSPS